MRHLYVKRTNVAHRLPRGKRAPGTEINHSQEHRSHTKQKNKETISPPVLHHLLRLSSTA
ncbi:hypothetical protein QUF49_00800 [Fictibacillus sp. b24]|uniref:hypothetical protein n=1 Tax=Fictibacillus sp. b24 TaxID=3055863 RepID=UPI0025A29EB3|nr:hypothetical protein [Fictibacillus sp. b24]MDM5314506.1 hypothetical protein [Fictibacillus sp. b24]